MSPLVPSGFSYVTAVQLVHYVADSVIHKRSCSLAFSWCVVMVSNYPQLDQKLIHLSLFRGCRVVENVTGMCNCSVVFDEICDSISIDRNVFLQFAIRCISGCLVVVIQCHQEILRYLLPTQRELVTNNVQCRTGSRSCSNAPFVQTFQLGGRTLQKLLKMSDT